MKLNKLIEIAKLHNDYAAFLDLIPYAKLIGVSISHDPKGWLFTLAANPDNIGNPITPALHGGVVAGFMEVSAVLVQMLTSEQTHIPKIINFSIDYLLTAGVQPTYARCNIARQGKRIANITVTAWQTDIFAPIATARTHYLSAGRV